MTDVAAFQAASDRILSLNDKHREALSHGAQAFLLFRDPADLYDVEEIPEVEADGAMDTTQSSGADRLQVRHLIG